MSPTRRRHDLIIAANRLPVDRITAPDGSVSWGRSPGGLVTAMESVMRGRDAAWVGWAGEAGPPPAAVRRGRDHLHPVGLSPSEIQEYYEGFSNETLWPIYHDVTVLASFHRNWWNTYRRSTSASPRPSPRWPRRARRSGCTTTSCSWSRDGPGDPARCAHRLVQPHPVPAGRALRPAAVAPGSLEGLLGADFLGFQRTADAENFLRACRRCSWSPRATTRSPSPPGDDPSHGGRCGPARYRSRWTSAGSRRWPAAPEVLARAAEIRRLARRPEGPHARRRPARLHQGDPAPAEGLRGAVAGQDDRATRGDPHAGGHAEPRARGRLPPSARGGRGYGRADQRRVLRPRLARGLLPVPLLPACRDGRDVPGRRRHARDAAARRHEPGRQGVRHLPARPRRRPGAVGVRRRLARAAPGLHLQPPRHRGRQADDHARDQRLRGRATAPDEGAAQRVADHDVQRWATRFLDALAAAPGRPELAIHARHRHTAASRA